MQNFMVSKDLPGLRHQCSQTKVGLSVNPVKLLQASKSFSTNLNLSATLPQTL